MKKTIALILCILTAVGLWLNRDLLVYGYEQARGQLAIIIRAKNVDEVIADPVVSDNVKSKLLFIQEVKAFAEDSLGINASDNYSTFYSHGGETLMWVLTGCRPFSFEPYEWKFPLLGSFSYKGFFNKGRATEERQWLKDAGYDTGLGKVSAWSTLGWLRDPITSAMIQKPEGELAELIIHELTHATLYVKNDVTFNENLASFIGEKGAEKFLTYRFGAGSKQLKNYLDGLQDERKLRAHMLRGFQALDSLYKVMEPLEDTALKAMRKAELINKIFTDVDTLTLTDEATKRKRIEYRSDVNNTYFMSLSRYHGAGDQLQRSFLNNYHGNLRKMMKDLKMRYPSL